MALNACIIPSISSRNVFAGISLMAGDLRNLDEMMAERGIIVDHSMLYR